MPLIHLFLIQILNLEEAPGLSLSLSETRQSFSETLSSKSDSNLSGVPPALVIESRSYVAIKTKTLRNCLREVGGGWVGGLRKSGSMSRPENPSISSIW